MKSQYRKMCRILIVMTKTLTIKGEATKRCAKNISLGTVRNGNKNLWANDIQFVL